MPCSRFLVAASVLSSIFIGLVLLSAVGSAAIHAQFDVSVPMVVN